MLTTTRAAGRLTFSHLWPQNHLLRLFSISSLKSGSGWSTDPETRRRQYDKFYAKTRKEYAQNPEAREKKLIQGRAIKAARSGAYQRVLYQRNNFYRWVVSGLRHGFVRSWKTHTPKLDERTDVRLCSGCNMLLRKSLWWKRNNDSEDRYDCNPCFTKDWSRVHPIGYEHLTWSSEPSKSEQKSDTTSSGTTDLNEILPGSKP